MLGGCIRFRLCRDALGDIAKAQAFYVDCMGGMHCVSVVFYRVFPLLAVEIGYGQRKKQVTLGMLWMLIGGLAALA